MLDYLALVCLLALCVGHYFLVRGCVDIKNAGGGFSNMMDMKMAETNNLLNEVAELLDEFVGQSIPNVPSTQTGHPLMGILSTILNNKTPMTDDYGTQTERAIRTEILDPSSTTTEESEYSGHSTELPSP